MKRFFLTLLLLCLLPVFALAEEAAEIAATFKSGSAAIDAAILCDGSDETFKSFKKGSAATVTVRIPEDAAASAFYIRLKNAPDNVEIKHKGSSGKYETVVTLDAPGTQFVVSSKPLTGEVQLVITGVKKAAVTLQELRIFTQGTLPGDLPAFVPGLTADVLYIIPAETDLDAALLSSWVEGGRTVQVLCLTETDDANALGDALWAAGIDRAPIFGGLKDLSADSSVTKALVSGIRCSQAQLVTWDGSGENAQHVADLLPNAISAAADYTYDTDSACKHGVWFASDALAADESAAYLAQWQELGKEPLRAYCADKFADALHGDPASIPYPARDADGYLTEGEFLWEDPDNGLWAYVSPTLQIEIVRYEQPDVPRSWFVSDIRFKPEAESFHQQTYVNATFPGQMIYPETLAQTAQLVFGINGDYYIYREDNKATGNIIRNRKVLYNHKKNMGFPNLDTMALRDDGSISVYAGSEISAAELLAQGDVHDALSFGPYLVRDGKLRIWNGKNCDAVEPRNAIGMVEPGHLKVVTVEGRFKKGYGPAGVTLNMLAELLYSQGVEQGFNLDGGNTAVLIFMGEKLNRTAAKSGKGETSPRNMAELFGVGTSQLVHTDKLNGK